MSERYIRFVNELKTTAFSKGLGYNEVAEVMNVHPNTVRGWWAFRTKMDGDAVLRAISLIMDGRFAA